MEILWSRTLSGWNRLSTRTCSDSPSSSRSSKTPKTQTVPVLGLQPPHAPSLDVVGGSALTPGRCVNAQPERDPFLPPTNTCGDGSRPTIKGVPMSDFYLGLLEKLGVDRTTEFVDSKNLAIDRW